MTDPLGDRREPPAVTEPPGNRSSPGEARVRLFVALELPASVRAALSAWVRPVLASAAGALRPVAPENLHVTLCFLGGVPIDAVPAILEAVATARGLPAAPLRLGEGLWLPRRGPRVLAVALVDSDEADEATPQRGECASTDGLGSLVHTERVGRLTAAQAWLSDALSAGGWYRPERRPYLPHVTVARVRHGARVRVSDPLPDIPDLAFAGSRVTLYRSQLSSAGARYEALGSVELSG